jgi:hypothetical protein
MLKKPKVKLLQLWMLDDNFYQPKHIPKTIISNGIWETIRVKENGKNRIYTLRCILPYHKDLKINTETMMNEDMIIEVCHRVKIVSLPKYKSIMKKG